MTITGRTLVLATSVVLAVVIIGWIDLPLLATLMISGGSVALLVLVAVVASRLIRHGIWTTCRPLDSDGWSGRDLDG